MSDYRDNQHGVNDPVAASTSNLNLTITRRHMNKLRPRRTSGPILLPHQNPSCPRRCGVRLQDHSTSERVVI